MNLFNTSSGVCSDHPKPLRKRSRSAALLLLVLLLVLLAAICSQLRSDWRQPVPGAQAALSWLEAGPQSGNGNRAGLLTGAGCAVLAWAFFQCEMINSNDNIIDIGIASIASLSQPALNRSSAVTCRGGRRSTVHRWEALSGAVATLSASKTLYFRPRHFERPQLIMNSGKLQALLVLLCIECPSQQVAKAV